MVVAQDKNEYPWQTVIETIQTCPLESSPHTSASSPQVPWQIGLHQAQAPLPLAHPLGEEGTQIGEWGITICTTRDS